ncbi:MAG: hypothetical protein GTN78_13025, partial [Gemmatimonadales bacterium]|nr:hypothetical protein [Gemmatimonadales bacterium]
KILARLVAVLETHTRRSLNLRGLRRAIAVYNEQRSLLADLKRYWLAGGVNTVAYRRLRRMALTQDPVTVNERLRETLEGPEGGMKDSSDPRARARRLLLLAELAAPTGLVRLVEAQGAQVVAEDSDLDERDLAKPVPVDAETVEELLAGLANAYLSKPPSPR